MQKIKWQCLWSPTLGDLESTHEKVWGTVPYADKELPTVFFGCYSLKDFYKVLRHKGERHILWAGSDIPRLEAGYWLDETGAIKLDPKAICDVCI